MAKTVPITKQYPNEWCHRTWIWQPSPSRGRAHSLFQVEGSMDPDLGEFLLQVFMNGRHVDGPMMEQIRSMTAEVKDRAARERRVRDVMES